MSQDPISISTFIPESIGSKDILFENAPVVGTVDFMDGVIIFSPAFAYLLLGDLITPSILEPYSVVFAVLIALIMMSTLFLKPNYMTLSEWFTIWKDYSDREKDLSKQYTKEDGKPFDSMSIVPDDDTRKLTKANRVYPERDIIELDDGTMISIIEFSGSNLDMASQQQIIGTVNQYSQKLSSQLKHNIQFYMPMRPVTTELTVQRYKDQRNKLEVEDAGDEFMDAYLDDRISWVENLSTSTFIREQYVVIPVSLDEIYSGNSINNSSGLESIPGGEFLKDMYRGLTGQQNISSEQERRRKQIRELTKRRTTIGNILAVGPGNSYNIVDYKKSIALVKEFWEGEKIQSDEMQALSNEYPFAVSHMGGENQNKGD